MMKGAKVSDEVAEVDDLYRVEVTDVSPKNGTVTVSVSLPAFYLAKDLTLYVAKDQPGPEASQGETTIGDEPASADQTGGQS